MDLERYWSSTSKTMGYTDVYVRVDVDMLGPLYVLPGPIVL